MKKETSGPCCLINPAASLAFLGLILTFLVFALGMAAVITVLTISLAAARSGILQNLKKILPYIDRLSGVLLIAGGCYFISYGIYEIRILNNPSTNSNSFLNIVGDLQSHLSTWVTNVGGVQFGLTLWLLVFSLIIWGIHPALNDKAKRVIQVVIVMSWIVGEGIIYKGEMLVFPLFRLFINWPSRISNWLDEPTRWATPLEVFFTFFIFLLFFIHS